MRTQVGIVGAGPAGLLLSHLLHLRGIDSVVLESRSREYCESRVRAGVLEQGTVDVLNDSGVGERMRREGLPHHGIELRYGGAGHRIAFEKLVPGRAITVYGQQEVVKDLIAARLAAGGKIIFDVPDVGLHDLTGSPYLTFQDQTLECDVIAGCDGFHGVSRPSIPEGVLSIFERDYPFAWLGVLARVRPSAEELIYARGDRGFALHSMRSPEISRFYLQVPPDEPLENWPDERIWAELKARLETVPGFTLATGPILEKGVTPMRSFVAEPMQYGRLYLAGDAAHIVPPTGAKGLNLAVADVRALTAALGHWYSTGETGPLDDYSRTCLRRVWRAQHFSWWMTTLLHPFESDDAYGGRLQTSYLDYVTSSEAAATTLAENYVGMPW
ncbi:4-hydroxybenzoate 3-monooxygenase [Microtetraspora sp. NBRC 13810]|uniref:4-hydroxybenzoate 3-monooxygenase n=1 Tax=Microtetraspora sp. NBRC 13810 TaxID=3030990 RepID=UPI0024A556C3|nr:4-hydroxybenzoate 3-monooxygenase [Microtetraspora sp. NBRC 13810]GLW12383.1 4-hydroxybenzoate 3-monooxygenase [Microtetraspora sp. NBRC 13810]